VQSLLFLLEEEEEEEDLGRRIKDEGISMLTMARAAWAVVLPLLQLAV
jgi:hypothetical protein